VLVLGTGELVVGTEETEDLGTEKTEDLGTEKTEDTDSSHRDTKLTEGLH
jgi:hypothetical protein